MSKAELYNETFRESRNRWKRFYADKTVGVCKWEVYRGLTFKLECWDVEVGDIGGRKSVKSMIFQFWPEGRGFTEYSEQ